jgi:hypothetical protein
MLDPRFAPRRDDLSYLRRRTPPRTPPQPAAPAPAAAAPAAPAPAAAAPAAPAPAAAAPAAPAPAAAAPAAPARAAPARAATAPKISFDRPGRRSGATPAPAPSAGSTSLDLDAPAPTPAAAPAPSAGSTSLDLDAPAPTPAAAPVPRPADPAGQPPAEPPRRRREDVRVGSGGRRILTVAQPTVTLTRLQSGIGTLRFEAACGEDVGDLRLGAAYQLRSGLAATVQTTGGHRLAPPRSRRPLIVAAHERFGSLAVDLRQSRELERLGVYAFSEARRPLNWGGTLVVETFGGARIELPLESLHGGEVAMLLSLYNVRGELVLRAEMQALDGGVREACRAYGYDRITWLDDRTPVD